MRTRPGRGHPDRWVTWADGAWSADPTTTAEAGPFLGGPVPLTPTGPIYEPTGPDGTEVAVFLGAVASIPYPVTVEGEPPAVPETPPVPDDAVA
ncbi:hypothetical protein Q8791_29005 [Nocardiopsis sp. CT-R113]|uniref:DUF2510 domain-containing protein n=1 Tax=Nocardiopsis codii TaxID=3065942 RepID=A0ABU7KGA6_9ACTN|nr:hypothetical protein [Nocardiopsis sp. CT-R113]MEE2041271.1 hypothetical protein [Nocardiopsis sp. CT-R113]